jgi:hypothetical protein
MSLYRQTGRPGSGVLVAAVAAGLVIGALAGFLVAQASEDEPSLAEQVASLREDAQPVSQALELVTIEYGPAVSGGKVVAPTEYEASLDAAARAQQAFAEVRPDVEVLDPKGAAAVHAAIEELTRQIEEKAKPAAVRQAARVAATQLQATVGGQP